MTPDLTLHVLPPSHPCMTAEAALRRKGLEYERIDLRPGEHNDRMQEVYGEGRRTVPGLLVDGEPVHGSRAILARLEELVPEPSLFPSPRAEEIRKAERWGDEKLQDLGRRLTWGAMHFRPEALGTFGGGEPLDPAGIDRAIERIRLSWQYHRISAERLADDLAGLPAKIDHIDELAGADVLGGDQPNAADLQIGATLRILLTIGDLRPLIEGRPAEHLARRWFPTYQLDVPAGAYPAGWIQA